MTKERFRTLAWATLAVTIGVILWGAYVRASGSGAGCGSHWPTCNGEVIPRAKSVATVIEFTHRVTSGASFLMVLLELVWALRALPKGHPARGGAAASMFFMVTEAAVGALLVVFEHVAEDRSVGRAAWTSIHLVNTFLLVASLACTAWWASGGARVRLRGQGARGAILGLGAIGLLAVGVSGAITALGDTLFRSKTLAEGVASDFSPAAHFLQQLRVVHPIAAVVVAMFVLYTRGLVARAPRAGDVDRDAGAYRTRPGRDGDDLPPSVRRLSRLLAAAIAGQLLLGLANFALLAPTAMQIAHLLAADLVWIAFVLFGAEALSDEAPARATPPPDLAAAEPS